MAFRKSFHLTESKYHNRMIKVNGERFASKKEFLRWCQLVAMQDEGTISNLRRQVKYVLIPAQREKETVTPRGRQIPGKVIEREVAYYADAVYEQDGETIVEDVKGYHGGGAYEVFKIKRKLMLHLYGIRIREI